MVNLDITNESFVKNAIEQVKSKEDSIVTRKILKRLFEQYSQNNDLVNVYQKVLTLNELYSTNIFNTFKLAKHIVNLKIDFLYSHKDLNAVKVIAYGHGIQNSNHKEYNFYSFSTKYCSYHLPDVYPIYDKYVVEALWNYMLQGYLTKFKRKDLKDYVFFNGIINELILRFNLNAFSLKEIDDFLWYLGKKHFFPNTN